MKLEEMKDQLMNWLGNTHKCKAYKAKDCLRINKKDNIITMKLFTKVNEYTIQANLPKDGDFGYLGGYTKSRMCRAGETWNRGDDLADGIFCEEIWNKIMFQIVGYELVKIHKPISEAD